MPFLTPPTAQQRTEIESLCSRGLSDSYVNCYIQAPLQAVSAVAMAALDIPGEFLRGCKNADACVFKGEFIGGAKAFASGVAGACQSLAQIALIVMTVACGIFFPGYSYSALQSLNPIQTMASYDDLRTNLERAEGQLERAEGQLHNLQTQLVDKERGINRLQGDIEQLRAEKIQKEKAVEDLEGKLQTNQEALKHQTESLKSEKLTLETELAQLKKNIQINEEVLGKEIEQLKAEKIQKENDIRERQEKLDDKIKEELLLKKEIGDLRNNNAGLNSVVSQGRLLFENVTAENNKLKRSQPLKGSSNKEGEERNKQLEDAISKLKVALQEKDKTLLQLTEMNNTIKASGSPSEIQLEYEKILKEKNEEISELTKINKTLTETNKTLYALNSKATQVGQKKKQKRDHAKKSLASVTPTNLNAQGTPI